MLGSAGRFLWIAIFLSACGGDARTRIGEPCHINGAENHCFDRGPNSCLGLDCTDTANPKVLYVCAGLCSSDEDCRKLDDDPAVHCQANAFYCYRACTVDTDCLAGTYCQVDRCAARDAPVGDTCTFAAPAGE
jgi:hypothetical protein